MVSSVTISMLNGDEFTKANLDEDQLEQMITRLRDPDIRLIVLELDLGGAATETVLIMMSAVSSIRIVTEEGMDYISTPAG